MRTPEVRVSLIKLNFEWLCVKTCTSVYAYVVPAACVLAQSGVLSRLIVRLHGVCVSVLTKRVH
jgi:hypothetical protein